MTSLEKPWPYEKPDNRVRLLKLIVLLVLLPIFLGACQPYPDHAEVKTNEANRGVDFGERRELRLISSTGTADSLLLEFNQPLWEPQERDTSVPFEIKFYPRIPGAEMQRRGAASVLVTFPTKLSPAHRFTATIPAGWRALTGASFLREEVLEWETMRPILTTCKEVREGRHRDGHQTYSLTFCQPVEKSSVEGALSIDGKLFNQTKGATLTSVDNENKEFELSLVSGAQAPSRTFRIRAGVEAKGGYLKGAGEESFSFDPGAELKVLSSNCRKDGAGQVFELEFSHPLDVKALKGAVRATNWLDLLFSTSDNKTFHIKGGSGSDQNLVVLKGLRSKDGFELKSDVEVFSHIETTAPHPAASLRTDSFYNVPRKTSVLDFESPKDTRVDTWALQRDEVIEMLGLPQDRWRDGETLPIELTASVFSSTLEKARPKTRFLENNPSQADTVKDNFYLVRVAKPDGAIVRCLVSASKLGIESLHVNELAMVRIENGDESRQESDVSVALLDKFGIEVASKKTDDQGEVDFTGPWEREPVFVSINDSRGHALSVLNPIHLPLQTPSPGILWAENQVLGPGDRVELAGVRWSEAESQSLEIVSHSPLNELSSKTKIEEGSKLFRASMRAPEQVGQYHVRFADASKQYTGVDILVSENGQHETGNSSLTLSEQPVDGHYTGQFRWEGPGCDQVDVRATILSSIASVDGWNRIATGHLPSFPLPVRMTQDNIGGHFELDAIPKLRGAFTLNVELFNTELSHLVYESSQREIGAELIHLEEVENHEESSQSQKLKFHFSWEALDQDSSTTLRCALSRKKPDDLGWEVVSQGEAILKDEMYEWPVSISDLGHYRLEVRAGDAEMASVWEAYLEPDPLKDWEKLQVGESSFTPGNPLVPIWEGLPLNSPVWFAAFSGDRLLGTWRRRVTEDGSFSPLDIEGLRSNDEKIILLAEAVSERSKGGHPLVRVSQLDIARVDLSSATELELETRFARDPRIKPGRSLVVRSRSSGRALDQALVWWEEEKDEKEGLQSFHDLSQWRKEGRQTALERGLKSKNLAGPLELSESGAFNLKAPVEPGDYQLFFLAHDEDG